jgi:hypothetical protein
MRSVNIEEELLLANARKMRLPKTSIKVSDLLKIPTGKVAASQAIQTLLDDREDTREYDPRKPIGDQKE